MATDFIDNGKERLYGLTSAQQVVWLDQVLNPNVPIYNIGSTLLLEGDINEGILPKALSQVIALRDSLRISLVEVEGVAYQKFLDVIELPYSVIDVSSEKNPDELAKRLIRERFDEVFELYGNPLWETVLIKVSEKRYHWLFRFHHLVMDGVGMSLICGDICAACNRLFKGDDSLPDITTSYLDYIHADAVYLKSKRFSKDREYWVNQYKDIPPYSLGDRGVSNEVVASESYSWPISRAEYEKIGEYIVGNELTPTAFFLSLVGLYFSKISMSDTVVIGLPIHNRNSAKYKKITGMFSSVSPVLLKHNQGVCFANLVKSSIATLRSGFRHQKFPITEINHSLNIIDRQLFDVSVSFESFVLDYPFEMGSYSLSRSHERYEQTPLAISIRDYQHSEDVIFDFNYNPKLFTKVGITQVQNSLSTLLEQILSEPSKNIGSLSIILEEDRYRQLNDFNGPLIAYEGASTIHERFEAKVSTNPDAIAVLHGDESLSYQALNRQANRLALHLRGQGVTANTLVGIYAPRSPLFLISILGVMKAGAAYVPLDPINPRERIDYMIDNSQVSVLLTTEALLPPLSLGEHVVPVLLNSIADLPDSGNLPSVSGANDLAYMIYTSGSTGQPKGALVHHAGALNHIDAEFDVLGFMDDDKALLPRHFLQSAAASSDISVWQFLAPLMSGGHVVIVDDMTNMPGMFSALRAGQIHLMQAAPVVLQLIVDYAESLSTPERMLPLSWMTTTGEAASVSLINRWLVLYPDTPIMNSYGPSEASDDITYHIVREPLLGEGSLPIGRPLPNLTMYVLDTQQQLQPIGVPGELCVSGVGVGLGYWQNVQKTAEVFIENPFKNEFGIHGEVIYRTGDLGRWRTDGSLEFMGRLDDQVNVRGFRVELGEVEAALASIDGVGDVAVLVHQDSSAQNVLSAYLVNHAGPALSVQALRDALSGKLPLYMIPTTFTFMDVMPLNAADKIDRKALPAPDQLDFSVEYVAPEGETEVQLAIIWQSVLSVERVGRHDNFFSLGGHSLLAVRLVAQIRSILDTDITMRLVFEAPTLSILATMIEQSEATVTECFVVPANVIPNNCEKITPDLLPLVDLTQQEIDSIEKTVIGGVRSIQDIYPLGPLQEGILFHSLMADEGDLYVEVSIFSFNSRNDIDSFTMALNKVIQRHDILRTAVVWEGLSTSVQVVHRDATLPVLEIDSSTFNDHQSIEEQLSYYTKVTSRVMDITKAPLLRLSITPDPDSERWYALFESHHLLLDHLSLEIVIEEVSAILRGNEKNLDDPVSFREFIAQVAHKQKTADPEGFFTEKLVGIEQVTAPFGLLSIDAEVDVQHKRLSNDLSLNIRSITQQLSISPASFFHTVWGVLAAKTSRLSDVVFGTVLLGRLEGIDHAETMLGMTINTLPIRMNLDECSVLDVINAYQQELLDLLAHEQTPLNIAQRSSALDDSTPLFTSVLNYRHTDEKSSSIDALGMDVLSSIDRSNFVIDVSVDDFGQDFGLEVQVPPGLGAQNLIDLIVKVSEQLVMLLKQQPDALALSIDFLSEADRHRQLMDFNSPLVDYTVTNGGLSTIHERFEAQVSMNPDAIAVHHGDESLSYQALNRQANRLALHLRSQGVSANTLVGIYAPRSPLFLISILGVMKSGAAYVPLDPINPRERIDYMIDNSQVSVLLTTEALLSPLSLGEHVVPVLLNSIADLPDSGNLPSVSGANDLAYMIYTSGSTGQPKGALVHHAGALNHMDAQFDVLGFMDDDKALLPRHFLQSAASSSDVSVWQFLAPLMSGGQTVIVDDMTDMPSIYRALRAGKVHLMQAAPVVLQLMVDYAESLPASERALPLTWMMTIAEAAPVSLVNRWLALYLDTPIMNGYGPSEASDDITYHIVREPLMGEGSLPIGQPLPNLTMYVLDAQQQLQPIGVPGELCVSGVGVGPGYWQNVEKTAEVFIDNPYKNESGIHGEVIYRTGDLGRWRADGCLEFMGRLDNQVKVRGFRVELGEVEAALASIDDVGDVAVLVHQDSSAQNVLSAYLVSQTESAPSVQELRDALSSYLPLYMIPTTFTFLDAMPLNAADKIDRKALPTPNQLDVCVEYVAPEGETEEQLATIWQSVLSVEQVGRHDNFFALGGHSLLAIRLIAQVRTHWGVDVSIKSIFDTAKLSELAKVIKVTEQSLVPAITRAPTDAVLPLSYAQQRLWFIDKLNENAREAYHLTTLLNIQGKVSKELLNKALNYVVGRHDSLRTVFSENSGKTFQHILGNLLLEIDEFDLSNPETSSSSSKEKSVNEFLAKESKRPFDLNRGPLIRVVLVKTADVDYKLLVSQHHIITDGWSEAILVKELLDSYISFVESDTPSLPDVKFQYGDYAYWESKLFSNDVLQSQVDYWKTQLKGVPNLINLPVDHQRPSEQQYDCNVVGFSLSKEHSQELREFSSRNNVTLFMTLLAGWFILLSRLSGQKDIVSGTPVANRSQKEFDSTMGIFLNTLALRVDLNENPTVLDLLAQIKNVSLDAYANQNVPFEQVVEAVQPERSMSYNPIFQVLFGMDNTKDDLPVDFAKYDSHDISVSLEHEDSVGAQFDVSLFVDDSEACIRGMFEYVEALFEPSSIGNWVVYYKTILANMVANESCEVFKLSVLDQAGLQKVTQDFNDTDKVLLEDKLRETTTIQGLIESRVKLHPENIAVEYGDSLLTYQRLNSASNELAHALRSMGVGPDKPVAMFMDRSEQMMVVLLGILKAGGAYVPVDPEHPQDRIAYMLSDSNPNVVITQKHLLDRLPENDNRKVIVIDADWQGAFESNTLSYENPVVEGLTPNNLVYIIYTSGSTGLPKGVMNEHSGVVNYILWFKGYMSITEKDRVGQITPSSFDVSVWQFFATLVSGATLVFAKPGGHKDPGYLKALIEEKEISVIHFVPSMLATFVGVYREHKCLSLRKIVCSGEELPVQLAQVCLDTYPNSELINLYGPTEATIDVTHWKCQSGTKLTTIPIGYPIANTQMYVLDEYLQPVPVGVTGELYCSGVNIARGYLNKEQLTNERFIENPFASGDTRFTRMYRTGDLGRWNHDGSIAYLGRTDFQVKIRGFRIELGEIEAQLMKHPSISKVVVVDKVHTVGKILVAYYISGSSEFSVETMNQNLREHLQTKLPEYMVPTMFIALDAMPLTTSGKLDRKSLPEPDMHIASAREYVPPTTPEELLVAKIWQKLLNVERVGKQDKFFELGGHSLLVMELIEALRQKKYTVSIRTIFNTPSLEDFAKTLEVDQGQSSIQVPQNLIPDGCKALTPAMLPLVALTQEEIDELASQMSYGVENVKDIYPLAPLQEGILFHHQLSDVGDTYITSTLLSFDKKKICDSFLDALKVVYQRHDILRSAFFWEGLSQPVQVVYREVGFNVDTVALVPEEDAISQLEARIDVTSLRLNLQNPPLIRVEFAQDIHSDQCYLLLHQHHLICDHVSIEIILEEIQAILADDGTSLLPAVPFRNFVAQALQSSKELNLKDYFGSRLGDIEETVAPYGLTNVREDGSRTITSSSFLDDKLSHEIREICGANQCSPAALFHLVWGLVVARCSNTENVVFGTAMSGRLQGTAGVNRMLGMFMNMLPLRLSLSKLNSQQALEYTNKELLGLLEFELASLSTVQQHAGTPGGTPLFSAMLNYRHSVLGADVESWEGMSVVTAGERTNYPFEMSVDDFVTGFECTLYIDRSIDIEAVKNYVETALQGVVNALKTGDVTTPLLSLPIAPSSERNLLLNTYSGDVRRYGGEVTFHQRFEKQVDRCPESIAVVDDNGQYTYRELDERSNQLAKYLSAQSVTRNTLVGIYADRSIEFVVGILAIMKADGAYVPFDPNNPADRLRMMLSDSQVKVVLTEQRLHDKLIEVVSTEKLQQGNIQVVAIDQIDLSEYGATRLEARDLDNDMSLSWAYMIYTSGSTGMPKGAIVHHAGMLNHIDAEFELLEFTDVNHNNLPTNFLQSAASSSDVSVWQFLAPLISGGKTVILDRMADIPKLVRLIQEQDVHLIQTAPVVLQHLLDYLTGSSAENKSISSLKWLMTIAEACPVPLINKWISCYPNIPVMNGFGPTEASDDITYYIAKETLPDTLSSLPIGKPIPNNSLYVLDSELRLLPKGVVGELCVSGVGVGPGYWNNEERTNTSFVDNPYNDISQAHGDIIYRTGDIGYWSDDELMLVGRIDSQIKVRGFRVELGEIEATLAKHPNLSEVAVMAFSEDTGTNIIAAYVVLSDESIELDSLSIKHWLTDYLPDYMVPSAVTIMKAMPLNAADKIDRNNLPRPDMHLQSASYEKPVNDIEEILAKIWKDILKVDVVSRKDNFFDLGGHSLLIMSMAELLRQQNLNLAVSLVFEKPILFELAEFVTDTSNDSVFSPPANLIPKDCGSITPDMLPLVELSLQDLDRIADQVAGGMENIQDIYPLAPLQDGILFHHLMNEEGDSYITPMLFALKDQAHLDKFIEALQKVVNRHDVLRTAVLHEGLPQSVQVVLRDAKLSAKAIDLDPDRDCTEQLNELMDLSNLSMDFTQAPLINLLTAQDPHSSQCFLVLHEHHIISDHVTLEIEMMEVQSVLSGNDDLPEPVQYRDFVAYLLHQSENQDAKEYFSGSLKGIDETTAPFGLLEVHGDGTRTEEIHLPLPTDLSLKLRKAAIRYGVSPAILFHAAWALVVSRCSGRNDVVFGTVMSGRMQGISGSDQALGLFINLLPIRLDLSNQSLKSVIQQTKEKLVELIRYEQVPLVEAQSYSELSANTPLFSAILNYRHDSDGENEVESAWEGITPLESPDDLSNYVFDMSVDDLGDSFNLVGSIDKRVGAQPVLDYYEAALSALVEGIEKNESSALLELNFLSEAELKIVSECNNTTNASLFEKDWVSHFLGQVSATPNSIAVVCGEDSLRYQDLHDLSTKVAQNLRSVGVGRGDIVALLDYRNIEFMVSMIGILKSGAAYLPLDPTHPSSRWLDILNEGQPKLAIVGDNLSVEQRWLKRKWSKQQVIAYSSLLSNDVEACELEPISLDDLAYVLFTSGSTGKPKGVMIEHRGMINNMLAKREPLSLDDSMVVAQTASQSFDISVWQFLTALLFGGKVVIIPNEISQSPEDLLNTLDSQGVTIWESVPSMLQASLEFAKPLPNMRWVLPTGEALSQPLVSSWFKRYPKIPLMNAYGPAECSDDVAFEPIYGEVDRVCIGTPVANAHLHVLDQHLALVPAGVVGELAVSGPVVGRGYLGLEELTAEKFIQNPYAQDEWDQRMYLTGDLVRRLGDGRLEYVGRTDNQVKLRGFRIELGEIEQQILSHESVQEAVVVVHHDQGGDGRLVAYMTTENDISSDEMRSLPNTSIDIRSLKEYLRSQLPLYMIPSALEVCTSLPLTDNGKIDRQLLSKREVIFVADLEYIEPVGKIETKLAEVWQSLLSVDKVGRNDNFFDIGGHSLLAIQLISKVANQLNKKLSIKHIFEFPILHELASHLAIEELVTKFSDIPVCSRDSGVPLSWAQQRLWFVAQLDDSASEAYNMHYAFELNGELDPVSLHKALSFIIERHEILRTTFSLLDGHPVQVINSKTKCKLPTVDLTSLDAAEQEGEVLQIRGKESAKCFDLAAGPLIRFQLLKLDNERHVLLTTAHHIVSDGWSEGIMTSELGVAYQAILLEDKPEEHLAPLPIQYADYSHWQRTALDQQYLDSELQYWQSTLSDAPSLIELPVDYARKSDRQYNGGAVDFELSADTLKQLNQLAKTHGVTLHMVLFSAWTVLLSRLSAQTDIVVGSPVANRSREELENLVGFFINTVALRTDLSSDPTMLELFQQVKSTTLDAYEHQSVPFEQVVERISPERSLTHSPIFQTVFTLDNTPSEGSFALENLELNPLPTVNPTSPIDLSLTVEFDETESDTKLECALEFSTDIFKRSTIERWVNYFKVIVSEMCRDPSSTVLSIPLLDEKERYKIVALFNENGKARSIDIDVITQYEKMVSNYPGNLALKDSERAFTYAEVDQFANQLANEMVSRGVDYGERIAIIAPRCIEQVICVLAILKLQGTYVPVAIEFPVERQKYIIEDSESSCVLTLSGVITPEIQLEEDAVEWVTYVLPDLPRSTGESDQFRTAPVRAGLSENPAYIVYTSGSTGKPKGVLAPQSGVVRLTVDNGCAEILPEDRIAYCNNPSFDVSTFEIWGALLNGALLDVIPQSTLLSPEAFCRTLKENKSNVLLLSAALFNQYATEMTGIFPQLKYMFVGGEAADPNVMRGVLAGPKPQTLFNIYGPSEATSFATHYIIENIEASDTRIPIGKPIANTQVYILDGLGQPTPIGVEGEICIAGCGLASGYLNRADLSAESFVNNTIVHAGVDTRIYKSGDFGFWREDGVIEFTGRRDHQVKIRGFRIELDEVQARIIEYPDVLEALVVVSENGDGDKSLLAYVGVGTGSVDSFDKIGMKIFLKEMLPAFMVPAGYIPMEKLPINANGKVDRSALPPPDSKVWESKLFEPPINETERSMVAIWQEYLDVEKISRTDNFFDLGGHSLMSIRLINSIREEWGVELSVKAIFEIDTLADLSEHVQQEVDIKSLENDDDIENLSEAELDAYLSRFED